MSRFFTSRSTEMMGNVGMKSLFALLLRMLSTQHPPFKTQCFLFFIAVIPILSFSQSKEQKFLNHLITNNLYDEAILYIHSPEYTQVNDSSKNYLLAFCYKQTAQAKKYIESLQQIKLQNPFYFRSKLWQQNYFLQKDFQLFSGSLFFDEVNCPDSLFHIQQINKAALFALRRDTSAFRQTKQQSLLKRTPYIQHFDEMEIALKKLSSFKKKKPFVAGLLSTIVPGLGKFYAQKPKQGLSSFMTVGIFALQAYEMYKKGNGFRNPGFYFYGSVFTAFYLGNILGAVHAAKKHNYDFIKEQEYEILRQADYPFRNSGF